MTRRLMRMSSHMIGLVIGAFFFFSGAHLLPSAHAADNFVFGFEDLPLMDGLTQVAQDSVLFDTPQGRIVQASAVGAVSQTAVTEFYNQTLPQLGWIPVADTTYQREGELLRLEFSSSEGQLIVEFLAEPSGTEPSAAQSR